jgi:hypothetical protein
MKFGLRTPFLKKRIAARTSWKRVVRHSLGIKAPRGLGWLTDPKKAAYNRVYNRTTFSIDSLFRTGRRRAGSSAAGLLAVLLLAPILGLVHLCSPSPSERATPRTATAAAVSPPRVPDPVTAPRPLPTAKTRTACKLRSEIGGSSPVIGRVLARQSVEILETEKHWQRVRCSGGVGWIHDGCMATRP